MKRQLIYLLLPTSLIQGCATAYGCKGFPNSPICKSAVEAYKATEGSKPLNPVHPDPEATTDRPLVPAASGQKTGAAPRNVTAKLSTPAESVKDPAMDPAAVRTPPKVMRIWIAPWEDSDGDLQTPGFIFTELEPRRWVMGKPALRSHPTLTPLQVAARKPVTPTATAPTSMTDPLQAASPQGSKGRLQIEEPDYE